VMCNITVQSVSKL